MQATIHIKGYDGIERLALGKRAAVYSVRKSRYKKPVVVRVLLPHLMGERRFLARFEKSVRLALGIKHDNIVNILDYGRTENAAFIVVERYTGSSLRELLSEQHRVPVDVAMSILLAVSRALEAAHAVGLVHRDVRPSNIIVTGDGAVKLDGFAMATDIGENGRVTHAGRVTSTPGYMSPEQTRGENLGAQSDIFSLGAVAFELFAGRRAFGTGDFGDIVDHVQNSVLPMVGSLNPLLEPAIERIVATMLEKDPGRRYRHVSELIMDLEEAMDKYSHRVDDGAMAAFAINPAAYHHEYTQRMVERLVARTPTRDGAGAASRAALVRYYQKLVYLDPQDQGARQELARLLSTAAGSADEKSPDAAGVDAMRGARYANLDPNALYRVVLESIDPERENEASFSLKLSLKLRTPLPRVKSLVRSMPARVSDRVSYKSAMHLARIIEDLGGRARLDVCPAGASAPLGRAAGASDGEGRTGAPRAGRSCPQCGWVDETGAEFCEVCLHRFVERAPTSFDDLTRALPEENPLADDPARHPVLGAYWTAFTRLPRRTRFIAVAVLLAVVALILVTR